MTDKLTYEAQMRAHVRDANAVLPAGWRIKATVLRSFPHRNKWRLEARHDGQAVAHWEAYQVAAILAVIVEWIKAREGVTDRRGTVVTTDAAGWITSIEDAP